MYTTTELLVLSKLCHKTDVYVRVRARVCGIYLFNNEAYFTHNEMPTQVCGGKLQNNVITMDQIKNYM